MICSRCGSREPNPGCYVCAESEADDIENCDAVAERLMERADWLRTERKDREWEESLNAKSKEP